MKKFITVDMTPSIVLKDQQLYCCKSSHVIEEVKVNKEMLEDKTLTSKDLKIITYGNRTLLGNHEIGTKVHG